MGADYLCYGVGGGDLDSVEHRARTDYAGGVLQWQSLGSYFHNGRAHIDSAESEEAVMYDAYICCATKDASKLRWVLRGIRRNTDAATIHVVSPDRLPPIDGVPDVAYHLDAEVLDVPRAWAFRPDWVYQQMSKLLQEVTDDQYLVVDADCLILNRLPLDTPAFLLGREQDHEQYYAFTRRMFGFGREYDHSFVAEVMLFDRRLVADMLALAGGREAFIARSYEIIDGACQISEYETYGNYVSKYHPDAYAYRAINAAYTGREASLPWTGDEIARQWNHARRAGYDTYAVHSWT